MLLEVGNLAMAYYYGIELKSREKYMNYATQDLRHGAVLLYKSISQVEPGLNNL
jgi:hypothetical protein